MATGKEREGAREHSTEVYPLSRALGRAEGCMRKRANSKNAPRMTLGRTDGARRRGGFNVCDARRANVVNRAPEYPWAARAAGEAHLLASYAEILPLHRPPL